MRIHKGHFSLSPSYHYHVFLEYLRFPMEFQGLCLHISFLRRYSTSCLLFLIEVYLSNSLQPMKAHPINRCKLNSQLSQAVVPSLALKKLK